MTMLPALHGSRGVEAETSAPPLIPLRVDRHEFAGAAADIGIMIPLAVGVAATAGLSLVTVFLCVAAVYCVTALAFRVPVPVQPMKAMAASIIALGLSSSVVSAAGLEIGLFLLLVGLTPLARLLGHLFPRPVVRGIQLGIGLLLLKSALVMAGKGRLLPGVDLDLHVGSLTLTTGVLAALAIAVFLLLRKERRRLPAGLVVLAAGMIAGLALAFSGESAPLTGIQGPHPPLSDLPSLHDAWLALFAVVLPQLPLSLGNAVFATDDVLHHYFGAGARRVTPGRLCLSKGLANLACGLVAGMPLCHGSGGATAHYRLGARTAGATLLAGALYAVLAVAAGFGLSPLLIPAAVLAGMLIFVAVEHLLLITDLSRADDLACAGLIALVAVVTGNLAIGFVAGWLVYTVLKRTPLRRLSMRWPSLAERLAPPPERVEVEAG